MDPVAGFLARGGAAFSFADGHTETHLWKCAGTMPPPSPDAAGLPIDVSDDPRDFNWILAHMSVPLGSRPVAGARLLSLKVIAKESLVPDRGQQIIIVVIGPTGRHRLVDAGEDRASRRGGVGNRLARGDK